MNEKLLENNCVIDFKCLGWGKCLLKSNPKSCKYIGKYDNSCNSSSAQVNRMMLHCKHIGLDLTAKGFSSENIKPEASKNS